jgi:HSP20 family protein
MRDRDLAGWMWAEACELVDQAERLHRQFFRIGAPRERTTAWEPPVDMFETEDTISISIALPGVDTEHIKVVLDEDLLAVTGVRPLPTQGQKMLIHRLEIPYGRFERRIRLPARAMKLADSTLNHGLLVLTLLKL